MALDRRELPRDQAQIRQRRNPQADVETFLDQVDAPVVQHEIDSEFRIARHEFRHHGPKLTDAETHRRVDAELAAHRALDAGRLFGGLLRLGDDPLRPLEDDGPASVRLIRRVVRLRRRTPSASSNVEIWRLTMDFERPSASAAAVKPPSSTTLA